MGLKKIFQKTWASGLLIFSMLAFKKNKKTVDIKDSSKEGERNKEKTTE